MDHVRQTRRSSLLRQPAQGAHAFRRKLCVTGQGARRRSLESSAEREPTPKQSMRLDAPPSRASQRRTAIRLQFLLLYRYYPC